MQENVQGPSKVYVIPAYLVVCLHLAHLEVRYSKNLGMEPLEDPVHGNANRYDRERAREGG